VSGAIVKVPSERLSPNVIRRIARDHWGLTNEQMCGMHVHHQPPRCEGGKDIPEHLYVCSPPMHQYGWHNNEWFMNNLQKAVKYNTGRKDSEETRRKKSEALKGRNVGHSYEGGEKHPNSKKVIIEGVEYVSQQEAANALGITLQGINYRMKNWGPERGYCYGS